MQRLLLVLIASILYATWGFTASQPTFIFLGEGSSTHLGRYITILEDPEGKLTPTGALADTNWKLGTKNVPDLGLSGSAHWFRLDVENKSQESRLVLHIDHPDIDLLDLYLVEDGHVHPIAAAGMGRPLNRTSQSSPGLAFQFDVEPSSKSTILGKLQSSKNIRVPITIGTHEDFTASNKNKHFFVGGYIGIMLVMAIYNFFIFISTKDKSYLLYVIYIILVGLTQLSFLGFSRYYIWPSIPYISIRDGLILTGLTAISASEFMRNFILVDRHLPWFRKVAQPFYALFTLSMTLSLMGFDLWAYGMMQVVSAAFAPFLLYCAFAIAKRGYRPGYFFLLAWSLFLIGVMLFVLKDWSVLPYNGITKYTMPVGSVAEVILLSFGLADRINILRREKEASQAEALAASLENERIIREQNAMLESKVKERTHALQESNENLKQTQSQLVNAEKMASLGQLTAGIAHEINNPINFITSNVEPLRRNIADIVEVMEDYRRIDVSRAAEELAALRDKEERVGLGESIQELDGIISSIAEGSSRTAEIVRGLRNFSRLDEDDLKEADLNEGLRSTLTVLGPQYRNRVDFVLQLGELPRVECFPGKVNQVFMNILTNAVQATLTRPDQLERRVTVRTQFDGTHVQVIIADNGIGMSEAVRARVFEPFFTTKAVGEGTGLGMAIVFGIIQDHHGEITVDSMPGAGTEFRISLPIRQQRRARERA
jgi:two-component system NtrC family sensor kinase